MRSSQETRRDDIVEVIGGVLFADPYRWLEEEDQETLDWQTAQNALADRELRGWVGFESLRARVESLIAPLDVAAPRQCAGRWYRLEQGISGSRLIVSREIGGPGQIIELTEGDSRREAPARVDWWRPSPKGRFVAFGVSEAGGAQGGIQLSRVGIADVDALSVTAATLKHVAHGALAWLPDSSGFYYVAGLDYAWRNPQRRLFFHRIGDPGPDRAEPLRGISYCVPQVSPDGRHVTLVRGSREPRADLILDRESGEGWKLFLHDIPAACYGHLDVDRYIAITTLGAERGRVVSIPLASAGDPTTWTELVPQSEGVLRTLDVVSGRLVVCDLVNASSRIRVFDAHGKLEDTVPIPAEGAVSGEASWTWWHYVGVPMVNPGDHTISFVHSSFTCSPAVQVYDLRNREVVHRGESDIEFARFAVSEHRAPADDGAEIPVRLVHRSDVDLSQPRATVIFAYGGYNHALVPAYLAMFAALIERGGVFAFAHIRGGGEYGGNWWRTGHHEQKQRSFEDIYSVAQWLVREGRTSHDRLGVVGASNGGMNVAVAITQRPDLFAAGVALVPQCDLLRYGRDPFYGGRPIEGHHNGVHIHGGTWRDAGQVSKSPRPKRRGPHFAESVYPDPFAYSPYHAVRRDRRYPALLVVSASEDLWCPPWHGRKLIARLQAEGAGDKPAVLRVWMGNGHDVPVLGTSTQVAEWVGFLLRHLGINDANDHA